MEWNIFGIEYHRSTALRINNQLAESLFPPEVAKFLPEKHSFLHDGYSGYFRSFWGSSEEYMIRLCTRLRQPNDLHLRPRVESITEEYATMIGASAFTVLSSSTFATSIIIVLLVLKYLNIPLYAQCLFGCMCRKV